MPRRRKSKPDASTEPTRRRKTQTRPRFSGVISDSDDTNTNSDLILSGLISSSDSEDFNKPNQIKRPRKKRSIEIDWTSDDASSRFPLVETSTRPIPQAKNTSEKNAQNLLSISSGSNRQSRLSLQNQKELGIKAQNLSTKEAQTPLKETRTRLSQQNQKELSIREAETSITARRSIRGNETSQVQDLEQKDNTSLVRKRSIRSNSHGKMVQEDSSKNTSIVQEKKTMSQLKKRRQSILIQDDREPLDLSDQGKNQPVIIQDESLMRRKLAAHSTVITGQLSPNSLSLESDLSSITMDLNSDNRFRRSSIRNTPKKSIRRSSTRRTPVKIAENSPIKNPKPVENESIKNTPINLSTNSESLTNRITPMKSMEKSNNISKRNSRGSPGEPMIIIDKASINESIKGTKPRLSNRIALKSVESTPTKNAQKRIESSPVTTPNKSINRSSNRNSTLKNREMLSVSNIPEIIEKVSINESIKKTTPRKSNRISVKSLETLNAKKSIEKNPEVEHIETSSVDKTPNKSITRSSNRNSTLKNPEMLSVTNASISRESTGGPSVSTSARRNIENSLTRTTPLNPVGSSISNTRSSNRNSTLKNPEMLSVTNTSVSREITGGPSVSTSTRRNIENSLTRTTPLNPVGSSISNTSINSSISKQRKLVVVRQDLSSDEEEEIIFKDTSFNNSKRSERILVDPVDKQAGTKSSLNSGKRGLVDSADKPAGEILSFNTSKKKMVISVNSQAVESIGTSKQKATKSNTSGDTVKLDQPNSQILSPPQRKVQEVSKKLGNSSKTKSFLQDWSSDEEEEIILKESSFNNSKTLLGDPPGKQVSPKFSFNRSERRMVNASDKQMGATTSFNSSKRILVDSANKQTAAKESELKSSLNRKSLQKGQESNLNQSASIQVDLQENKSPLKRKSFQSVKPQTPVSNINKQSNIILTTPSGQQKKQTQRSIYDYVANLERQYQNILSQKPVAETAASENVAQVSGREKTLIHSFSEILKPTQQPKTAKQKEIFTSKKKSPAKVLRLEDRLYKGKQFPKKKLIKPAWWATEAFQQHLLKKVSTKFDGLDAIMETNILLEKLSEYFKSVTASNKNREPENVEYIKKILANANVIKTNYEFFFFALEWFPKPIARKVVPIHIPVTNEVTIPYDVDKLHTPISP